MFEYYEDMLVWKKGFWHYFDKNETILLLLMLFDHFHATLIQLSIAFYVNLLIKLCCKFGLNVDINLF